MIIWALIDKSQEIAAPSILNLNVELFLREGQNE